jgi:GTP pyrophosphokinase
MKEPPRFAQALAFAATAHAGQVRKGTSIPYISHPLAVAALAMEHGANEDQAIAALLHDTIEDCGVTDSQITELFGAYVALMVRDCTDTDTTPKPPWKERKQAYLAGLAAKPAESLLISACDKLHNMRCIVADLHRDGIATLQRFNGGAEGTLWYYTALCNEFAISGRLPLALMAALQAECQRLREGLR